MSDMSDRQRARIWAIYQGREVTPGNYRVFCHTCGLPFTRTTPVGRLELDWCADCSVRSGNHGHRAGTSVQDEDANGGWGNVITALEGE